MAGIVCSLAFRSLVARFHPSHVSTGSWLALAYLIGPGSILALSAYSVAVRRLATSTVATYP